MASKPIVGETAMVALEGYVDVWGLQAVLECLEAICTAKAAHVMDAWQDKALALAWTRAARVMEAMADRDAVKDLP